MRVTSWNCVCLADLERHAVAFPEQVERLADARRLMEEVLDAVGRGDEAKPRSVRRLIVPVVEIMSCILCGRGRAGRQRAA